jgi:hypothetical protein
MNKTGLAFWGGLHVKLGQHPGFLDGFCEKSSRFNNFLCNLAAYKLEQEGLFP